MTDTERLVEKIARALFAVSSKANTDFFEHTRDEFMADARAALAAIEGSGTHCVAPMNANGEMVGEWRQSQANGQSIETGYYRMLSARPRITGETK